MVTGKKGYYSSVRRTSLLILPISPINKIFIHTLRSLRFMWWEYFGDYTIRLENLQVLSPTSVYDSMTGIVEDSTL
jgi:hypothetical protein